MKNTKTISLMTPEKMRMILEANQVIREKCELYGCFIESLLLIMFDTYMGDDITSESDRKKHFKWCWDKNVRNFKEEGYHINNIKLYTYFLNFSVDTFYNLDDKRDDMNLINLISLWKYLYDFDRLKTKVNLDVLFATYNMFEEAIINY